ncbi:ribbon-helix-helix protein, CopG family [Natrarchaeobaculum aegyptiacum]|uniref:Uncharacterized protein n=1 Tax=Natrarchaeobaculum aegyptiacum TaxID=745377 RepID=A0A2Z2HTT0_9EURY|nr:ribbon-helix-helix protein, CopG family [Natrarchaeobaculum aegyptiacum]ARS90641.1 hypothetical protein B1756_13505 [Natrarchaeobaculum aegyptiacum]
MSKVTFRADDELVDALEELDVSKSEALREALRSYLERSPEAENPAPSPSTDGDADASSTSSLDDLVRERVDELVAARLDDHAFEATPGAYASDGRDVNVTISLEGSALEVTDGPRGRESERGQAGRVNVRQPRSQEDAVRRGRAEPDADVGARGSDTQCGQCGEMVDGDHVYCPNCGEKRTRRLFCDCGDELRSDWSFCPGCGRRTPAADVLERERP